MRAAPPTPLRWPKTSPDMARVPWEAGQFSLKNDEYKTINAGKGVERREPSHMVGGSAITSFFGRDEGQSSGDFMIFQNALRKFLVVAEFGKHRINTIILPT